MIDIDLKIKTHFFDIVDMTMPTTIFATHAMYIPTLHEQVSCCGKSAHLMIDDSMQKVKMKRYSEPRLIQIFTKTRRNWWY